MAAELGTIEQLDRERVITLSVSGELISPETGTRLDLERPLLTRLGPLGDLKVYGHEFAFDGALGWITVRTSQEVDLEAVRKALSIEPRREYDLELRPEGFAIRGRFEPGIGFQMTLAEGLESVLGGKLRHDYEATVVFGNVQPSFGFASPYGQYMLLGGERALEFKTVNMNALAVRVSQIFQNNLVFFLDNGRYYDYWSYGEEGQQEIPLRRGQLRQGACLRYDGASPAIRTGRWPPGLTLPPTWQTGTAVSTSWKSPTPPRHGEAPHNWWCSLTWG